MPSAPSPASVWRMGAWPWEAASDPLTGEGLTYWDFLPLLSSMAPPASGSTATNCRWSAFLASDWALPLPIPLGTESPGQVPQQPASFMNRGLGSSQAEPHSGQHYTGPREPHSAPESLSDRGSSRARLRVVTLVLCPHGLGQATEGRISVQALSLLPWTILRVLSRTSPPPNLHLTSLLHRPGSQV